MRVIDRLLDIMEKKGITAYKVAQDTGIKPVSYTHLDVYKRQT